MEKNPIMVRAGKKAARTRQKNKEAVHQKWVRAGHKAWETRRANQKNQVKSDQTFSFKHVQIEGLNKSESRKLTKKIETRLVLIDKDLRKLGYKIVKV